MVENSIKKFAPEEIKESFNFQKELHEKVTKENKPNVVEDDPNEQTEVNYVYDKKLLHTAQFKNLKDKTDDIFSTPYLTEERKKREELSKKRRYLGDYDKKAAYLAGPES